MWYHFLTTNRRNIRCHQKLQISEYVMDLTRHYVKNTFFIYKKQRYKPTKGVPTGLPLSVVLPYLFTEDHGIRTIESACLEPIIWQIYDADTFMISTSRRTRSYFSCTSLQERRQFRYLIDRKKIIQTATWTPSHTKHPAILQNYGRIIKKTSRHPQQKQEMNIFKSSLLQNGYPNNNIKRLLRPTKPRRAKSMVNAHLH